MASEKGRIISVFSAKGGVGKTITTLNLAGIYKIMGKKVLVVDLDLYSGGIAVSLNKEVKNNIFNLADDLNNNRYKDFSDYVTKYDDSIDFLASPKDPRQAGRIEPSYINMILDKASFFYDVVLIDTNHILNEMNVITLDRVDKILLILTNDPLDIKNMRSLLTILRDSNFENYKVLLNNSRDPFKNYFELYDIKSIIKNNIDYTLSKFFYIKDIDKYIMNGKIITLLPKVPNVFAKDFASLMNIGADLLSKEGEL